MSKRHNNSDSDHIFKKIRKLEKKLLKQKEKLNAQSKDLSSEDENISQEEFNSPPTSQLPVLESQSILEKELPHESQPGCSTTEAEFSQLEETLPEEFLQALGEEGVINDQKGPNINQQIVDRWTNIIKLGIKKENLLTILNKYPTPTNFCMANAPKLNSAIIAAISENVLKRDKKFEYKQNLTGKVLSCLGGILTDIMKGNLNSVKLIESINDAAKILCNSNHYDSLTRRHFILNSVQKCVKQAITNVPIDTYLFGEDFNERLKTAKAVEKSGSAIKQTQPFSKQNIRSQPSTSKNLNWKGPSQRRPLKENTYRVGPKNQNQHQHQMKRNYKQQQPKPTRRR